MESIRVRLFLKYLFFILCMAGFVVANVQFTEPFKITGSDFMYGSFSNRIDSSVFQKQGTLIEQLPVKGIVDCVMRCIKHHSCLSLNYGVNQTTKKQLCDLLNFGSTGYQKFLVPKANFSHMRQQVGTESKSHL